MLMKQSQWKVVVILIPPPSNSLPRGEGVRHSPLHLLERARVRQGEGEKRNNLQRGRVKRSDAGLKV